VEDSVYEFKFMKPDKTGLWAYCGRKPEKLCDEYLVYVFFDERSYKFELMAWWCYLCPVVPIKRPDLTNYSEEKGEHYD